MMSLENHLLNGKNDPEVTWSQSCVAEKHRKKWSCVKNNLTRKIKTAKNWINVSQIWTWNIQKSIKCRRASYHREQAEKSGQNRYDAKKQHISIETFRRSHQSLSRKMELRHLPSTKGHQLRAANRAPSKEFRFYMPSSEHQRLLAARRPLRSHDLGTVSAPQRCTKRLGKEISFVGLGIFTLHWDSSIKDLLADAGLSNPVMLRNSVVDHLCAWTALRPLQTKAVKSTVD